MRRRGIVRALDELGRIVLPIEWRRVLEIEEKDPMEFFIDPESRWIMIRKYQSQICMFCQTMDNLIYFHEKFICSSCIQKLRLQVALELSPSPFTPGTEEAAVAATTPTKDVASGHSNDTPPLKRRGRRRSNAYKLLLEAIRTHPNYTQTEWAGLIGISQSRVSQLLQEIRESEKNSSPIKGRSK